MLSKILYELFLVLYSAGIHVVSAWNPKAKKWIAGRKNIFSEINAKWPAAKGKTIWMHCASLGEFEQGRPLLEALKANDPAQQIVLSFFSPSGYEVMKDYKGADAVFYLPMDSASNAKKFIDAIDPKLVLWVKYEYWYHYLTELNKRNIPTLLVSGIFRPGQPFFQWYGKIWKEMLGSFSHFFVQNEESKDLLASIGFKGNVTLNGDTRFDRVVEIASKFNAVPGIDDFCGNHPVLVAGSTWEEDEIELLHFVNVHKHIRFIIAPHEIDAVNLKDVKDEFPNSVFYSEWIREQDRSAGDHASKNVLIIDNIGMLSRLYKYATVTYVGGGFGADGVHNVLEAAVYGKPVVFGPVYEKYDEAIGLAETGAGISINGPVKLEAVLNELFNNGSSRNEKGEAAKAYVLKNAGASGKIIQFIQANRLLTS